MFLGVIFFLSFFFFKGFTYLFLERGRKKEGERSISVWLPLTRSLPGTLPKTKACTLDWESNQWPFGSQASTQSTEPHQPGCNFLFFFFFCLCVLGVYWASCICKFIAFIKFENSFLSPSALFWGELQLCLYFICNLIFGHLKMWCSSI